MVPSKYSVALILVNPSLSPRSIRLNNLLSFLQLPSVLGPVSVCVGAVFC